MLSSNAKLLGVGKLRAATVCEWQQMGRGEDPKSRTGCTAEH